MSLFSSTEQNGLIRLSDARKAILATVTGTPYRPLCLICDDIGMTARFGPCSCQLGIMFEAWLRNIGWTPHETKADSGPWWWPRWWPRWWP